MKKATKDTMMFWVKILYYIAASVAFIAEVFFRALKETTKGIPYIPPINWWYLVALGLGAILITRLGKK